MRFFREGSASVFSFGIILLLLVVGTLTIFLISSDHSYNVGSKAASTDKPIVGAIYFSPWFTNPQPDTKYDHLSKELSPSKWHYRLPFFTQFSSDNVPHYFEDSQQILDQEIQLAHNAGLSYFAFDYSSVGVGQSIDTAIPGYDPGYGLRYFRSSPYKGLLNFALILTGFAYGHEPTANWKISTVPQIVGLLKNPSYQKIAGDRPLIYIFKVSSMVSAREFATYDEAKQALQYLRGAAMAAGLANPYIVGMDDPSAPLGKLGLDTISAYSAQGPKTDNHDYSVLAAANVRFWNNALSHGYKVIPIVNTGWDWRPQLMYPADAAADSGSPWYNPPTPGEFQNHLTNAVNWVNLHAGSVPSKTMLIYAWNELVEGGWLVPTNSEGDARLRAVAGALGVAGQKSLISLLDGRVTTQTNPGTIWLRVSVTGSLPQNLTVQLYDPAIAKWGAPLKLNYNSTNQTATFVLPAGMPGNCSMSSSCVITAKILDADAGQILTSFTFRLGPSQAGSWVVSSANVNTNLLPWILVVKGSNLSQSFRVRIMDRTGKQWGSDISGNSDLGLTFVGYQLPGNAPPSNCNAAHSCSLSFFLVDRSGKISSKYAFTLPPQP